METTARRTTRRDRRLPHASPRRSRGDQVRSAGRWPVPGDGDRAGRRRRSASRSTSTTSGRPPRSGTSPYLSERCVHDLDVYCDAVLEAKRAGLPVKLGLEVDYVGERQARLAELLQPYPFDFRLGSVHWLDGMAVDMSPGVWEVMTVDEVWQRYTDALCELAVSGDRRRARPSRSREDLRPASAARSPGRAPRADRDWSSARPAWPWRSRRQDSASPSASCIPMRTCCARARERARRSRLPPTRTSRSSSARTSSRRSHTPARPAARRRRLRRRPDEPGAARMTATASPTSYTGEPMVPP